MTPVVPLAIAPLAVRHVSVAYHDRPVLWDVSWSVPATPGRVACAAGAFIAAALAGWNPRALPLLLAGAALTAGLAVLAVAALGRGGRIRDDAAMALVLSIGYGVGVVLISVVQSLPVGGQAGLKGFIVGQAAGMSAADATLIAVLAALSMLVLLVLFRPLAALCFDREFAASTGLPVGLLDGVLLGLVMIEVSGAHAVDLDVDCVLYGQLEALIWPSAYGPGALLDPAALAEFPTEVATLAAALVLTLGLLAAFWKELRLAAFDPDFAAAIGFAPCRLSVLVLVLVAIACVASFWAVGSVLVIAALVAPASIARLLTSRYAAQFALSAAAAAAMGAGGYWLAALAPDLLALGHGLSASGMIAVVAGLLLVLAWAFGPFGRKGDRRAAAQRVAVPAPVPAAGA